MANKKMSGLLIFSELPPCCWDDCPCQYDMIYCLAARRSLDIATADECRPDWCPIIAVDVLTAIEIDDVIKRMRIKENYELSIAEDDSTDAAMLIVDKMPKACGFCDLMSCDDNHICHCIPHDRNEIKVDLLTEREEWCPLHYVHSYYPSED